MKCDKCGAEVGATAKFCRACGQPISQVRNCSSCGQEIGPTASFCKHCGARQEAAGAPPVALPPQQVQAPANPPPSRDRVHAQPQKPPARRSRGGIKWLAAGIVVLLVAGFWFVLSPDSSLPGGSPPGRNEFGVATAKNPAPDKVMDTKEFGLVPVNQVLVRLREGLGRKDADGLAQELGGSVVGQIDYVNLFQIETRGASEGDLKASLDKARQASGVQASLANSVVLLKDVPGVPCSLLGNPVYRAGKNAIPYQMIGLEAAWDIIHASGVKLNDVHVGVLDSGINRNLADVSGKAKVSGLTGADEDTAPRKDQQGNLVRGRLQHGDMTTDMIVANPENDGVVGVAGSLGDKLKVTVSRVSDPFDREQAATPNPKDPTQFVYEGQTYVMNTMVDVLRQINAKATVINYSWGAPYPDWHNEGMSLAYRDLMTRLATEHPKVLFVAAAGNEGDRKVGLDGANYGIGGLNLPNVITVGALDNDGKRWSFSNFAEPGNESIISGVKFSGEVTLAAGGVDVPVGIGDDGKVATASGTSFSAPQVTAAAAILRSINPKLMAADVKDILVKTASEDVFVSGNRPIAVDKSVGGRVLRVDNAVYKVIGDMLGGKVPDRATLQKMAKIEAVAIARGGLDYTIKATLAALGASGTDVTIDVNMSGSSGHSGLSKQHLAKPGDLTWPFSLLSENAGATLVLRRLDTGACSRISFAGGGAPTPVPTPGGQSKDDRCAGYVPTGRNTLRDIECSMNNPGEINDVIRVDPQGFMPFEPAPGR